MTRRRKFEVGDLIVLKKSVRVDSFPSIALKYGATPSERSQAVAAIVEKTNIKNVVRRVQSFSPGIKAGSVGIIRCFENVFMLEFDRITQDQYKALSFERKKDALVIGSDVYLNKSNRKHMHVLIDERLVAFAPGAKLFEKCDDAIARYEKVVVKFEGTMVLDRVNDVELQNRLEGKRRQLGAILDTSRVTSIERTRRDGSTETKEGSNGNESC